MFFQGPRLRTSSALNGSSRFVVMESVASLA